MAAVNGWEETPSNIGDPGRVYPGDFVHFSELPIRWSKDGNSQIQAVFGESDYAPQRILSKSEMDIKLSHDTGHSVVSILKHNGFRGGPNRIARHDNKGVTLSWWAVPWDWDDDFELNTELYEAGGQWESTRASRYGNYRFTFKLTDLLESYREICSKCPEYMAMDQRVSFRKLGTFTYRREVMYAVLVCPKNLPLFRDLPPVEIQEDPGHEDSGTVFGYVASDIEDRTWLYKPTCLTKYGKEENVPLSWDHVSFAFYLPEGHVMPLPNVERDYSTFEIVERSPVRVNKTSPQYDAAMSLVRQLDSHDIDINGSDRKVLKDVANEIAVFELS